MQTITRGDLAGVLRLCPPGVPARLPLPDGPHRRKTYRQIASVAAQCWGRGFYRLRSEGAGHVVLVRLTGPGGT